MLSGNALAKPIIETAASNSMFPRLKMKPAPTRKACAVRPATSMRSLKARSEPKVPSVKAAITEIRMAPTAKSILNSSKRQRVPESRKVLAQVPRHKNEKINNNSAETYVVGRIMERPPFRRQYRYGLF